MSSTDWLWTAAASGAMAVDWWSVRSERSDVEPVAKPAVMISMIAVALSADIDPTVRGWILTGLVCGLIGDVALLPRFDRFVAGLASFLIGHIAYIVAFVMLWRPTPWIVVGLVGFGVLVGRAGLTIDRSLRGSTLRLAVVAYIIVTGAVIVSGAATGTWLIVVGTLAFAGSDALLGTDRFVARRPRRRLWIHVLYHLGQATILAGIIVA